MKFARTSKYVQATVTSGVLAAFVPSAVEATRRSGHHSPDLSSSPHRRNSGRCSMLATLRYLTYYHPPRLPTCVRAKS